VTVIRTPYGTVHHAGLTAGSANAAVYSVSLAPGSGWDGQKAFKAVEWLQISLRNLVGGPVTLKISSRVAPQAAWMVHYEETFGGPAAFSKDILVHLPALLTEQWQKVERGTFTIFAPLSNDERNLPPPHVMIETSIPAGATFGLAERAVTDSLTAVTA
jgi:hypothetical protein